MSFSPGPLFKYCVSSPGQQQASSIPEHSRKMGAGELLRETTLPLLLGTHVVANRRGEKVWWVGLGRLQLWGWLGTRGDGTFWNTDNLLT